MRCDLQRASMLKRISAALFDFIILSMVVVGIALLLSVLLGYDGYTDQMQKTYDRYESEYSIDFEIPAEEYEALTEEQKKAYDDAFAALNADEEFRNVYTMVINLTLIIITFSILISYLILEFFIPIILKNGQTLGKKIFGIGVMRADGVKLSPLFLFIRTVLGKFTVETELPVLIVVMIYFNSASIVGVMIILLLAVAQIVLLIATRERTPIHDMLAQTVTVDITSQMIFDSREEMLEYKKKIHAEEAKKADY